MKNIRKQSGFTLIELMIVIASLCHPDGYRYSCVPGLQYPLESVRVRKPCRFGQAGCI